MTGVSGVLGSNQTKYVSGVSYTPQGVPNLYGYGNNLWRSLTFTSRLEWATADDEINQNSGYDLLHQVYSWNTNGTNDNGTLRSSQFWHGGGPGTNWIQFNQTYTYDGANRLTAASDSGGWSRAFGYDQYGNMWVTGGSGVALAGNTPTSNVYNPANNHVSGGSYDAAGNQLIVNGDTLAYDANNHVSTATDNVTHNTETYIYDGAGERVMKFGPGGETVYVYDALGQLADEYSTVLQNSPCTTCYLSYDLRGDVRLVTDQNGNVVARHDFLPFGTEVPANIAGRNSQWGSTTDVEQKFTGQIRDNETGMDYFHARYYDAPLGRFTSPDPQNPGADPTHPRTWNGYSYVGNNPLRYTDPTGRCFWDGCVVEGYATYVAATAIVAGAIYLETPQGQQLLRNAGNAIAGVVIDLAKTLEPGPYAGDSIPLDGPSRNFTSGQHGAVNTIGKDTGCHTCGNTDPGTKSGNFVIDHQPPSALNKGNQPQRGYPQCLKCSQIQGGEVRGAQQNTNRFSIVGSTLSSGTVYSSDWDYTPPIVSTFTMDEGGGANVTSTITYGSVVGDTGGGAGGGGGGVVVSGTEHLEMDDY